ncbi:MAG: CotH kinase family protein [Bacteroidota bacterium]
MKKKLLNSILYVIAVSIFAISPLSILAQVFTGSGGTIQNNGIETFFNLPISGLPTQLDSTYGIEQVCVNINHTAVEELYISLISPQGRIVSLSSGKNVTGANFTNTCFDSRASSSVTINSAPFTGSYKPVGYLGRFNDGLQGNGTWQLAVKDYLFSTNSGSVVSWSITFGTSPSKPVVFTSSNLPIVVINTNSQTLTDQEIVVDLGVIYNGAGQRNYVTNSWNEFNGKTRINIRGNTSKDFEKKSYSLELQDLAGEEIKAPLLGMPSESDWVLGANYPDKTLLRNQLTYDLCRDMGHYSPRISNVEVILNGEYQGVYSLMEKPKRDDYRIDINKLSETDNFFPDITGGYIIKIDRTDEDGWYSLMAGNSPTSTKFYYQYVYPKDTAITVPQKDYIKSYMDSLETVLNSTNFADPVIGYKKYIDVASFIDYFIINELSKNVDGYRLSTILYKHNISKGGKLHIGPAWDYDIAWHNCNYGNTVDPAGWQYQLPVSDFPSPTWWDKFMQDQDFKNQLSCRWSQLRQSLINTAHLNSYIDYNSSLLNESQQRNFVQWPVLAAYISPNPQVQPNANYQGELSDLKSWIASRIPWMDSNINGTCQSVGVPELIALRGPAVNSYPNPFINNLKVTYSVPEGLSNGTMAKVKIELLNVIGDQVEVLFDGNKAPGSYEEAIATQALSTGVYIVKLSVNDKVVYQKTTKVG